MSKVDRVLVACEFSGRVRDAFRARGFDAVSCDLLPTHAPGPHIQGDVLKHLDDGWDLMIAHPECRYLCKGGMNWLNREPGRREKQDGAVEFVNTLLKANIPRIAVENPRGILGKRIRPADQSLFAWNFGDMYKKDFCLWLKGLPLLVPTVKVRPIGLRTLDYSSEYRHTSLGGYKKSITLPGVALAMAKQWGDACRNCAEIGS